jgi:deazaflavin-dependent oxidoreductase (nitroreductase family)
MADQAQNDGTSYNTKIIEEFRTNGGHVGGIWEGTDLILVHHIGAHPAWYHNLKANPMTTAEAGGQTFPVLARELDGRARAELWPALVARYPTLAEHQAKTTRQVPVIMLTPQEGAR